MGLGPHEIITGVTLGGVLSSVIGVVMWVSKTKVSKDTCAIVRRHQESERQDLIREMKKAEEVARERHQDLKTSLDKIEQVVEKLR